MGGLISRLSSLFNSQPDIANPLAPLTKMEYYKRTGDVRVFELVDLLDYLGSENTYSEGSLAFKEDIARRIDEMKEIDQAPSFNFTYSDLQGIQNAIIKLVEKNETPFLLTLLELFDQFYPQQNLIVDVDYTLRRILEGSFEEQRQVLSILINSGITINSTHFNEALLNERLEAIELFLRAPWKIDTEVMLLRTLDYLVRNFAPEELRPEFDSRRQYGDIPNEFLLNVAIDLLEQGAIPKEEHLLLACFVSSSEAQSDPHYHRLLTLILEHKDSIDLNREENGCTPLMAAVARGNKKAVELLLKAGADPDIALAGKAPIERALEKECEEIVTLLVEHHALIERDIHFYSKTMQKLLRRLLESEE